MKTLLFWSAMMCVVLTGSVAKGADLVWQYTTNVVHVAVTVQETGTLDAVFCSRWRSSVDREISPFVSKPVRGLIFILK